VETTTLGVDTAKSELPAVILCSSQQEDSDTGRCFGKQHYKITQLTEKAFYNPFT
jgi:hypothetical protein